jgi:hypothetical protein
MQPAQRLAGLFGLQDGRIDQVRERVVFIDQREGALSLRVAERDHADDRGNHRCGHLEDSADNLHVGDQRQCGNLAQHRRGSPRQRRASIGSRKSAL